MSMVKFAEVCFAEMMLEDLYTDLACEPDQRDLDQFNISASEQSDALDLAITWRREANASRHS